MSGSGETQEDDVKFEQYDPSVDPRVMQSFPGVATSMTLPQGGPGQLDALAAQLAGGFGQSPSLMFNWLDNLYDPTNYQTYGRDGLHAGPLPVNRAAEQPPKQQVRKTPYKYPPRATGAAGLDAEDTRMIQEELRNGVR